MKFIILLFIFLSISLFLTNPKQKTLENNYFLGSKNYILALTSKEDQVEKIFQQELPKLDGNWSVVVKDLKTQKTYQYQANSQFPAASLYKLTVLWAIYDAIEKSQIHKDDPLGAFTVDYQLNSMITISSNDSALLLAELLGWDNIENLMRKEGFSDIDLTSADSPFISAQTTEQILERIYKNTAVSYSASEEMKALLFNQQINDRIPKYLPSSVKVGHKTGEVDNIKHDAAIILGKKSHYIFVFLSQTPVPEEGSEQIAKLSRKIYYALESQ